MATPTTVAELLDTIEAGILVDDGPEIADGVLPAFDALTNVLDARTALDRLRALLDNAEQESLELHYQAAC